MPSPASRAASFSACRIFSGWCWWLRFPPTCSCIRAGSVATFSLLAPTWKRPGFQASTRLGCSTSPTRSPALCAAFVGILLAARIGIGNRDAGGRVGIAGDRLVCHRWHQPFRRDRFGARAVARFVHPDDDQQRCQPAERQFILAANHHRRSDHCDRLF